MSFLSKHSNPQTPPVSCSQSENRLSLSEIQILLIKFLPVIWILVQMGEKSQEGVELQPSSCDALSWMMLAKFEGKCSIENGADMTC